jgi:ATP-binding cassette, subfamily B (MDR/TAP), member 1
VKRSHAIAEGVLSSIRTALALRATDKLLLKYKTHLNYAASLGRKRAPILGIQTGIYMFMICAAYALAFWYGIHLFARGEAKSSGNVITTLFSIIIGTNAFAQLAGCLGSFLRISSAGAELLKVVDETPTSTAKDSGGSTAESRTPRLNQPLSFVHDTHNITFTGVKFSYPLRPTIPVLKNFSLKILAGTMTALIGPSGSGKSTIVGLLERWYNVDEGMVCLGKTNIRDFLVVGSYGTRNIV